MKYKALLSIFFLFCNTFYKFNHTGAQLLDSIYHVTLDSIYHMTLKLL